MSSIDALFETALSRPEHLPGHIDSLGPLSPELAVQAVQAASEAFEAKDLVRAEAAFTVAMLLFGRVGDGPRAVGCGIQRAEIMKMLADTEERHESARQLALGMMGLARQLRLVDLMFHAQTVAADSAYFAAQSCMQAQNVEGYRRWLLVTAKDCVEALELMETAPESDRARNLVSLITVTVQDVTRQTWPDEKKLEVDQVLRRITLAVEARVPLDAEVFTAGLERQCQFSLVLAQLSYDRGSPDIGRARLLTAMEKAEQAGDLAVFMSAGAALYEGERSSCRSSADLAAVRLRFTGVIDEFRRLSRSRAGRLWTAQQLDDMSADIVADEFSRITGRDVGRAFQAIEMVKARNLLDEMRGLTRDLPEPALAVEAAKLEAQILHLGALPALDNVIGDQIRLVSRLPISGLFPSEDLNHPLAELEDIYARHDAGFVDTAAIGRLDGIVAALGPREAIVEYHIPYHPFHPAATLLILLITARGALPIHVDLRPTEGPVGIIGRLQVDGKQPVDVSPFGNWIVNTRMSIQKGDDDTAITQLAELHRVLVGPLVEVGFDIADYDILYIVPHGILHGVPFAALRTPEGRFMAEDIATVVVPSASVWEVLRDRETKQPTSFLGFANPIGDDMYPRLPETEAELNAIAAYLTGLDVRVHIGGNATEAALRRDLPGRGIVHFATHGEFPEVDVMNMHSILLSSSGNHAGHVNAEELRGMDFTAAELVVLSICDGGVYRFGPGDEPYGLLSALLVAGACNVVGPAWPIDDTQARLLITEFYQSLMAEGPAAALRTATVSRLRAGAEIRDWAGFVHFGAGTWPVAGSARTASA